MENELPPFYYGIMRILDCGFTIEEAINPDASTMLIGYGMNFLFDIPASWIMFGIRVDFKEANTGAVFVSGTVQTTFSIKDLVNFVDENGKVVFPSGALETLFGIAFGHLRAILAKNLGGTRFANFYVPVIDAKEVFNDLLATNIEKFKDAQARGEVQLIKKEDKQVEEDIALAPTSNQKHK